MTADIFIICMGVYVSYFLLQIVYTLVFIGAGWFESRKRRRQRRATDFNLVLNSAFTFPVSILLPAHNEAEFIRDSVAAILRLDYPEYEVIIIDDGSTDGTLDILKNTLDLEQLDALCVDRFDSGKIKGLYVSRKHPHVRVLSKESGKKKAGALNAGLNLVRYRFICVQDADTVLNADALNLVMSQIHRDPDRVIACGSYFGLLNGLKMHDGRVIERNFIQKPIIAYQNIEYIRSFIGHRMAWSAMNGLVIVSGGFGIWRRDIMMALGGFSPEYSSEDLEFTLRVHQYRIQHHPDYKILMLPHEVGWTMGPRNVRELMRQRNRWQRVKNEAMVSYRHMIGNPGYGILGLVTLPYFLLYESLGIFFELSSLVFVGAGWALGLMDGRTFLTFFLLISLTHIFVSLLALLIYVQKERCPRLRDVLYLVLLSFLEFFWFHWIVAAGRLGGTLAFLKGEKKFDKSLG